MRACRVVACLALGVVAVWGGAAWAEDQTSNVHFSVIRDYNGKPVRNASVILHPVTRKGQQARSGLQLKTDSEGNTNFDGVPYGQLRIQVLAQGFQTYGEDFEITKPDTQITIKLKRPVDQYSVYGSKPQAGTGQGSTSAPDSGGSTKPEGASAPKADTKGDAKSDAKSDDASGVKADPTNTDKPQH